MTSPIGNMYIERRTLSVPCYCGAKVNAPCVNRMDGGRTLPEPHPSRIRRIEGRLSATERLLEAYRELEAAARKCEASFNAQGMKVVDFTGVEAMARLVQALAALDRVRSTSPPAAGR